MATPGNNSYIWQSGPLTGWAWDWDTRKLYDTRGTVVNQGGTLPLTVVTMLQQDPQGQSFFDQYYSRYQTVPYQGYQVRGQGGYDPAQGQDWSQQPPMEGGNPPSGGGGGGGSGGGTQPGAGSGAAPSWWKPEYDSYKYLRINDDGSVSAYQWTGSAYASNFEESGFGAGRQLFPQEGRFATQGQDPNGMYYTDIDMAWRNYEQRTGKRRPSRWQEVRHAPVNYRDGAVQGNWYTPRDWEQPPPPGWGEGNGQQPPSQPPPSQPPPSQPPGQPPPADNAPRNTWLTDAQKKTLEAEGKTEADFWRPPNQPPSPFMNWLFDRQTGKVLTTSGKMRTWDEMSPTHQKQLQEQGWWNQSPPIAGSPRAATQPPATQPPPAAQPPATQPPTTTPPAQGQPPPATPPPTGQNAPQPGQTDAATTAWLQQRMALAQALGIDPLQGLAPQYQAQMGQMLSQSVGAPNVGQPPPGGAQNPWQQQANPWAALLQMMGGGTGNQIGGSGGVPTFGGSLDPSFPGGQPPQNPYVGGFPMPTSWGDWFTGGQPSPGQPVGGENGAYRIPSPFGDYYGGGNFTWPWQEGGGFSDWDQQRTGMAQDWMATLFPWWQMQREGTQWNQQFNENQRLNNARMMMDMAAMSWEQQAAQAKFNEDVRQYGMNYALQQAQVSGYMPDASGRLQPTQERMAQIAQNFASRGLAQELDPITGLPTGNLANTLEQNQYIAQNFGFRVNPNTGQRELTLPAQKQLQNLWLQRGWVPVMNPDGSYVLDANGNPMLAPSEEHSSRIAQQFGYRINPNTGEREKTLEATWQDLQAAMGRAQQTGYFIDPQTGVNYQTLEYYRDEFGRAMDRAAVTGTFVDPLSGQASQTTQEQQRQFENLLAEAGLTGRYQGQQTTTEQQRQFENMMAQQNQQAQFLGTFGGQQTVAEQQRLWENMLNQQRQASDIASQTGYIYDPYTNEKTQTLAGQQQLWGQGFQQREADRSYQQRQMEMLGYDPTLTSNVYGTGATGTAAAGEGASYGGGTNPQTGEPWPNPGGSTAQQPAFANPWERPGLTQSMQQQLWSQNYMFPEQQKTERRGQNLAAFGRTTRMNNAWT